MCTAARAPIGILVLVNTMVFSSLVWFGITTIWFSIWVIPNHGIWFGIGILLLYIVYITLWRFDARICLQPLFFHRVSVSKSFLISLIIIMFNVNRSSLRDSSIHR